jgi:hypothetical protein
MSQPSQSASSGRASGREDTRASVVLVVALSAVLAIAVPGQLAGQAGEQAPRTTRQREAQVAAQRALDEVLTLMAAESKPTLDRPAMRVDVVRVTDGPRPIVHVRHTVGWVAFAQQVDLSGPVDWSTPAGSASAAAALRSQLKLRELLAPIQTRAQAFKAVDSCHPSLSANIRHQQPTEDSPVPVRWFPEKDTLLLQVYGTVDKSKNHCVRALLNLRTGSLTCNPEVPCYVR